MSVLFLFTISIFLQNHVCISGANDTLIQGEKLSGNETLVSKGNLFEFGFFTQDNISYFLGIWVKNSSIADGVVWVANRDNPVTNIFLAELSISLEGDLVLTQSQSIIWSANIMLREPISGIAMLLDNGNLVLKNRMNSSQIMWQSSDHPTDTWLPGVTLGYDPITGKNLSLSSGLYSLKYNLLIYYKFTISHMGSDLIYVFSFTNYYDAKLNNFEYDSGMVSFQYLSEVVAFIKLNNTGYVNFMQWDSVSRSFITLYQWGPKIICDYSLLCGNSFSCSVNYFKYKSCGCISGFLSNSEQSSNNTLLANSEQSSNNTLLAKWYNQCPQTVLGDCTKDVGFYGKDEYFLYSVVEYPDNYISRSVQSPEGCQYECSSDCSCIAYSYEKTCKIWHGNSLKVICLEYVPYGSRQKDLLVRVGFGISSHIHHKRANGLIILYILGFLSLIFAILILYWRCKKRLLEVRKVRVDEFLTLYSYFFIKKITRNFSDKLGEGGFGVVYKGIFSDSTQVAIKALKARCTKRSSSGQKFKRSA